MRSPPAWEAPDYSFRLSDMAATKKQIVAQTFFPSELRLCVKNRYIHGPPGRQTKKTSERLSLRRVFRLASWGAANVSIFHTQAECRRKKRLADVFFVWRPGGAVDVSFLWVELEAKFKSSVRALSLRQFPAKANMVFACIGLGLLILPRRTQDVKRAGKHDHANTGTH